jgi:tRNA threonylcarbamoyl adenosine modification protein YjeE
MSTRVPAARPGESQPGPDPPDRSDVGAACPGRRCAVFAGASRAGKTTFVQGLARGLGIREYVQSPTFILVMEHRGTLPDGQPVRLYHVDLYRLEEPGELATFGLEDCLSDPAGIVVIEWADRLPPNWVEEYLVIRSSRSPRASDGWRSIRSVPARRRSSRRSGRR